MRPYLQLELAQQYRTGMSVLLGKYVKEDLDLSGVVASLHPSTTTGKERLLTTLLTPISSKKQIRKRQKRIICLRKKLRDEKWGLHSNTLLQSAATGEKTLREMLEMQEPRLKELYGQVLFAPDAYLAKLNQISVWLELQQLWRIWIVPLTTVLLPILIIVLPFVLIKITQIVTQNTEGGKDDDTLSFSRYLGIMKTIVKNGTGGTTDAIASQILGPILNPPWSQQSDNFAEQAKKWFQFGVSGSMFLSGIWNQIQAAIHLHRTVQDIRQRGAVLRQVLLDVQGLQTAYKEAGLTIETGELQIDVVTFSDMALFGAFWNNPAKATAVLNTLSQMDAEITVAKQVAICIPKPIWKPKFSLIADGIYHPSLNKGLAIPNGVTLAEKPHILLTGPNRGGKSTFCKSVAVAVLMAQSLGVVFAKSMEWTPVARIETALSPSDTLGRLSLFEAEIEFAKDILVAAKNSTPTYKTAIFMDEIFHSTNALDGVEASRIFLDRLYTEAKGNVATLISTHYTDLPQQFTKAEGTTVQPLCMDAKLDSVTDTLTYTYKCRVGVSDLSSVREILRERGLLIPAVPNPI